MFPTPTRLTIVIALLVAPGLTWAQGGAPVIYRATLEPETGILTVAGANLSAELQVTVDGQVVTVLPGATDSQLEVQVPVSVLMTPGTYRLTLVDPVRRAWDGFIVASLPAAVPAAGADSAAPSISSASSYGDVPLPRHLTADSSGVPAAAAVAPAPMAAIEDAASPFRTALGFQALASNTTGLSNTAVGYRSMIGNVGGSSNTAIGREALMANGSGSSNTAVGALALGSNASGQRNTAVGANALQVSTADDNTAVGNQALAFGLGGGSNTAIGSRALATNISGVGSVAVGAEALESANAGGNTGVGYQALQAARGVNNTGLGSGAGRDATGGWNVFIGSDVFGVAGDSNTIRIGRVYVGGQGQNRAFIAGVRGTTVSGGEAVYVDSIGQLGSGPVVPAANTVGSSQVINDSLTAADLAPSSVGTSELADGAVTAAKVAFAYAGLGTNVFGGTQQIAAGNLDLAASTATSGNVTKGGTRFLSNPGFMNTFLGESAGTSAVTGGTNTGMGGDALRSVGAGDANTASGYGALYSNVAGNSNTAVGMQALFLATGSHNTALGMNAGTASTTGSHNIYVGADLYGGSNDANTMRLGVPYNPTTGAGQNKTFVAGVAGTVLTTPAVQVFVDANGQLGTLVPAPITGTISGSLGATPRQDAVLRTDFEAQQALIAAQAQVIADLQARLAAVEAALRSPRGRR